MNKSLGLIPCAALVHKSRMLLLQRAATVPRNANVWVMPGGKLDEGETPRTCSSRELREETGVDIHPNNMEVVDIFHSPDASGDFYDLAVYTFNIAERPQIAIEPHKFQGYGWFTAAEMEALGVAKPAAEVARKLGLS